MVFTASVLRGVATPSDEAAEVVWIQPEQVERMKMHPSMRERIDHFRQALPKP